MRLAAWLPRDAIVTGRLRKRDRLDLSNQRSAESAASGYIEHNPSSIDIRMANGRLPVDIIRNHRNIVIARRFLKHFDDISISCKNRRRSRSFGILT